MAVKKNHGGAIVAMYLSPVVSKGAGGWAIVNGKIIKIPPRGPALKQIQQTLLAVAAGGRRGRR